MFVFNLPATAEAFRLMEVVGYVWAFVRDLFNLLFIFGLTWIGFRFILGVDVNGAKRNLGTILIAALLINFSLYATQLIIDVGNVAAAEIGDLFTPADGSPTQNVLGIEIIDVSSSFIATTDISSIGSHTLALNSYMATGEETDTGSGRELGVADALGMGLTIAILLILIGFVFAAGAFLMFARFFYLIFLMMFSPIMFLGFVLPKMQNISKNWWEKLINQTVVGPAYLFMLLVALRALDTLMQSREGDQMDTWGFIMSSLLVAAFVWASLMVAKKFGAVGSATAMNMGMGIGNSIRGYAGRAAGGATFGAAAGLLRGQIGGRAHRYADSDIAKDRAANSFLGRKALNITRKLGDTSFDARQVGGVGKKFGLGEGSKGGYKTVTEAIAKREKTYADSLDKVSDEDPVVASLQAEVDANDQAIKDANKTLQEKRKELSKEGITEPDRQIIRAQIETIKANIDDLEEEKGSSTEKLKAETYRRQTGSQTKITSGTQQEIKAQKDTLKEHVKELASLQASIRNTKDEAEKSRLESDKNSVQKYIAETKKALAEAEKIAQKEAGGYATTLEQRGFIKNLLIGRDKSQSENAGKEIRKTYKDKVKSKDKGKDKSKDSDEKKDKPEDKKE
jgi:hypothetical protein